jgi:hypothetical protein
MAGGLVLFLTGGDGLKTYGLVMLVFGLMIFGIVMFPVIFLPILSDLILPFVSDCGRSSYFCLIVNSFVLIGFIGAKVVFPAQTEWAMIPIIIWSSGFGVILVCGGIGKTCGKKCGWFEDPGESDLESPKSGPDLGAMSAPGPDLEANQPPKAKAAKW